MVVPSKAFSQPQKRKALGKASVIMLLNALILLLMPFTAFASEADLILPELEPGHRSVLMFGILVCVLGLLFGFYQFKRVAGIKAHKSMLEVADIIYETCKTYLVQQGKFIVLLFVIIGTIIGFYFGFLNGMPMGNVAFILLCTVIGALGSYGVAWYGIRMNTLANSRMAFESLRREPIRILNVPLFAGMSIGVVLICVELILMLSILLFVPKELAGSSFIGFAIGESLGASALRIAGGIFTKIADIGSDLMKIAFKIKEDDPRNPGVIADCTGDNAGDSVGPTADGFETYGVTGVAVVSFIVLAVDTALQATLLTWIFVIRILMIISSILSFYINNGVSSAKYADKDDFDFEQPLTNLIWITCILSVVGTFAVTYWMLGPSTILGQVSPSMWIILSIIMSCGTLGAALIPEVTKIFTSPNSQHAKEVVNASREGGASLNILAGLVAGNFSAFWTGLVFLLLMFVAYFASGFGLSEIMVYPSIFAFGLVAFGMLGMGPVTIAVDSYGPVTDNAQSIYELSMIENIPNIDGEIEKEYGFKPDFEKAKYYLESNDAAGNTFKATAKPVLIGTAVVGATTMIFSLILVIKNVLGVEPEGILSLLNPYTILGFMAGGAVIYWFTGSSIQAVSAGSYKAVEYIKEHIQLEEGIERASTETSKEVVKICTQYAQKGMLNIFVGIFSFALAFALISAPKDGNAPVSFFVAYLISIAVFGLYQAIYMANAGGCWDNAKKIVEVDLGEKGTELHDATVIGDTVGDPYKDTSSVSLNPIIKFTTLFGLLAMEISITPAFRTIAPTIGIVFMLVAMFFVYRSFYGMRIEVGLASEDDAPEANVTA